MAGALLASLGLLTASFAPSVSLLLWCYSVLTGLGFGLMYIPSGKGSVYLPDFWTYDPP